MRRERDAYYTPRHVADAIVGTLPIRPGQRGFEGHVGGASFADPMRAAGLEVAGCDLDAHAWGLGRVDHVVGRGRDFLDLHPRDLPWRPDWIIGNPPYKGAEDHIRQARWLSGRHVVFLLRMAILASQARAAMWREHPARRVLILPERPGFTSDPITGHGGGTDRYDYAVIWWDADYHGPTTLGHLSWRQAGPLLTQPCRRCGSRWHREESCELPRLVAGPLLPSPCRRCGSLTHREDTCHLPHPTIP